MLPRFTCNSDDDRERSPGWVGYRGRLAGAQALGGLSVDGKSLKKGKPSIQKAPIEGLVLEKLLEVIFA